MQLRTAIEDFLQFCAVERQLSRYTIQAYAADLADFEKCRLLDVSLDAVSVATLKQYLEHMVTERKLSVSTVRRRVACLRTFFGRLARLGYAPDPFVGWQLQLPRRKRLPRALSWVETSSLLYSIKTTDRDNCFDSEEVFRIAIRLMVSTGIRVGELCGLGVEDVSPDGSAICIRGKGSRERVAYVTDFELRQQLCGLVENNQKESRPISALFVNRCGLRMKPQSIRSKLHRHAKKLGFTRHVTPHMLRHTAATLLIETGVDIRFVQRLLGHSSIATTEIYTHVSDEALRVTLERANVLRALSQGKS